MLKNGIFCEMVILVIFKGFLLVKNLEILIQIVPDRSIITTSDFYSLEREVSSLSSYLLPTHKKKNHTYLTDSQYSTFVLKKCSLSYNICHRVDIYKLVKCLASSIC